MGAGEVGYELGLSDKDQISMALHWILQAGRRGVGFSKESLGSSAEDLLDRRKSGG